jgi:hypothetical protein
VEIRLSSFNAANALKTISQGEKMTIPTCPKTINQGMKWVLQSKQVTPPEAFAIAAEFRRAASEVYACQQCYRDVILPGIENYWTGLAGERFLQISQPVAADLRQLAAELEQRAREIENIKITQYWWEEVCDRTAWGHMGVLSR